MSSGTLVLGLINGTLTGLLAVGIVLTILPPAFAAESPAARQLAQAVTSAPPAPGKSAAYDAAFKAMQEDPGNTNNLCTKCAKAKPAAA